MTRTAISKAKSNDLRTCAFVEKTPTSVPFLVFAVLPCKSPRANARRYDDIRGVVSKVHRPVSLRRSVSTSGMFERTISPSV